MCLVTTRTHYAYEMTEHEEMAFREGDIFQITDTLYSGVVGSWQAICVVPAHRKPKKGIIPNESRSVGRCRYHIYIYFIIFFNSPFWG